MAKCSFCGEKIPRGKGKLLVTIDGKMLWFDASKCERNFALGRAGKDTKWVLASGNLKEKKQNKPAKK